MNFNSDFSDVGSILNYANSQIIEFQRIQFSGDHITEINDISERLRASLRQKGHLNFEGEAEPSHSHQLRRIILFLQLNTTITDSEYNLSENTSIMHILKKIPQLTTCLLINTIWELKIHDHFFESIAYSPHWFSWHFLDQAGDSLKQVEPYVAVQLSHGLIVAIYQNIARSESTNIPAINRGDLLQKYNDRVVELINLFLTVDPNKFNEWTKFNKSKHLGIVVFNLLNMIVECAKFFHHKAHGGLQHPAQQVFDCLYENCRVEHNPNVFDAEVSEALQKLMHTMLNALQTNALMVNLDTFLTWAEIDRDDEYTLQRAIGEAAHQVEQLIHNDGRLTHDVLAQLRPIAVKPKTLRDVIAQSSLGEIMHKLDSLSLEPDVRQLWLDEFLGRGILVFDNAECLDTLDGNVDHLNAQQVQTLIKALNDHGTQIEDAFTDKLREYVARAARRFSVAQIQDFITFSIAESTERNGVDLELGNFNAATIELFNKCLTTELQSPAAFALMLQNPARYFEQMLGTALRSDQQQAIICQCVEHTRPEIAHTFVQQSLSAAIQHKCETMAADERPRLSSLIVRLHASQFETMTAFYQWFYKHISDASRRNELNTVACLLDAMHAIIRAGRSSFEDDSAAALGAPLLVMCAALLEHYRWDVITFTAQRVGLVEALIEIVHELRGRFLPIASAAERTFVTQKVAALKPLTRYYFQRFALSVDVQPMDFVPFIMDTGDLPPIAETPQDSLLARLLSFIVRCTRKECVLLAKHDVLRPQMFRAITLLARVVGRSSNNANSVNCLRNCAQNLSHVVRTVLLPECSATINSNAAACTILSDYVLLLKEFESHSIYEHLFMDAHRVFIEILNGLHRPTDKTVSAAAAAAAATADDDGWSVIVTQREAIKRALVALKDCEAKMLVLQAFNKCTPTSAAALKPPPSSI